VTVLTHVQRKSFGLFEQYERPTMVPPRQPQCCEQVCLWINLGGIVFIYALTPAVFAN